MKLTKLRIENFRTFDDETIHLRDYNCLVGPNGSGKSAILMALNVFFRENASTTTDVNTLSVEDFHHRNTKRPVRVTVTFEELSETAQEVFRHYYRQKQLVLFAEAVWDEGTQSAPVKQHGLRLVMRDFAKFFEQAAKPTVRVAELKEIYKAIRQQYQELPSIWTKQGMTDALREYEEAHPKLCELIPEPNELYGFTKGQNRLEQYAQWVYVPAVKDASSEQEEGSRTALGKLLARTVRTKLDFSEAIDTLKKNAEQEYADILDKQKEALESLQLSMQERLREYTNAEARLDLRWHHDAKSVTISNPVARADIGDRDFTGEIPRAGHGLQRCFLLMLLQELVENEKQDGPKLLLGFEEPELYQHPPQAQHLAQVLERLASPENNAQMIITTHSPYFVSSKGFENVKMLRKPRGQTAAKVSQTSYDKLSQRLANALLDTPAHPNDLMARVSQIMQPSQNELFFTSVAVLVEGQEDVAFISTQLGLLEQLAEFRRLGCHFVVADGKRNLSRLVAIALEFEIPFFVIFDCDGHEQNEAKREKNRQDNCCILNLCSITDGNGLPSSTVWGHNVVCWPTDLRKIVRDEFGEDIWGNAQAQSRDEHNLSQGVRAKNSMLIAYTLDHLAKEKKQSASLIKLCESILRYAGQVRA